MGVPIIEVNNVSMRFNLAREVTDTFKEYILKLMKGQLHFDEFWALRDISVSIQKGDSLALIGRNGCGKSTLLKIIAGVLAPTKGSVSVRGNIAPLIELGAGFDGDLTARENIFLNGAIMGYNHKFMEDHFDEIVDFSELKDFIDVPLKNYSSGMKARLGFAISVNSRPDILIVDEALSVGDKEFRKKCTAKVNEIMSDSDVTLLFVTHSLKTAMDFCTRGIVLEKGKMLFDGEINEAIEFYENRS